MSGDKRQQQPLGLPQKEQERLHLPTAPGMEVGAILSGYYRKSSPTRLEGLEVYLFPVENAQHGVSPDEARMAQWQQVQWLEGGEHPDCWAS